MVATAPAGTRPRALAKRVLVGRAMPSDQLEHTLLPKLIALPVFSSDALSSNAYATEEILLVLLTASTVSIGYVMPIAVAITVLMGVVVVSYRQTVRAYPSGGGAYIVSKENLGMPAGLVAAAALLIDYVLTVSVSITAGVVAISSAFPAVAEHAVAVAAGFIVLLTLANLRGVREAGILFAVPTYAFIMSVFVMVVMGLVRCAGGCPAAESVEAAHDLARAAAPLSLFVILHAFSSGSTALTGVEAISNGVPAFRRPQARNAATTLAVMGLIAAAMFLGISWLATHIPGISVSHERSVVAQVAHAVFGGGTGFYAMQAFTAAILILAANTAYQDFPRLASILARDGFLPSQFKNRGDRLVFSNGVIALATAATVLIWAFDADLSRLIQLYVVGVFTSFTLSQSGMVRHWLRDRSRPDASPAWRHSIAINAAIDATDTFTWAVTAASGGSVTFRSASTGANNVGSSVAVPTPAGVQAGDVMVAVVDAKAAPTVQTPAGWTPVSNTANGSSLRQVIYSRVATGSEPATHVWSLGQNRAASGVIVAYRGVSTAAPIQTVSAGTGTTASITAPSVTPTLNGSMIVGAFGINADSTITPPAGMTERGEIVSATRLRTEVSDFVLASAGATGAKVASAATASANIGQLVVLPPAGPPPANQDPTFDQDLQSRTNVQGDVITLSAHATDPDNDPLTYAATGLPPGLSINASGVISGTISSTAAAGSPYSVSVTVSDDNGASVGATDTLTWTVTSGGGGGGPITFRSASTGANNVGNNVVIPRPSDVQAGYVMIAVVDVKAAPTVTTPSGWTMVSNTVNGSNFRQLVYSRVATSGEPASYQWSYAENRAASGVIVAYSGVNTTTPVQTFSAGTGTTAAITAPSVTSSFNGAMVVGAFGINADSTIAPPAGMTERGEIVSAARLRTEVSDFVLASAGATGAKVASAATASANIGQLLVLRPAG